MSVQAISWVLDHSPTRGTERLVLISLANHAGKSPNDGAWESWPGLATIAREARINRMRTVQTALARLEQGGHIERVINGAPDRRIRADQRPNLYRILLPERGVAFRHPELSTGMSRSVTPSGERGDALRQNGVTLRDTNGVTESATQTVIRENRHRTPSGTNLSRAELTNPVASHDATDAAAHPLAQRAATAGRRINRQDAS